VSKSVALLPKYLTLISGSTVADPIRYRPVLDTSDAHSVMSDTSFDEALGPMFSPTQSIEDRFIEYFATQRNHGSIVRVLRIPL
jgi:hypothetical protein